MLFAQIININMNQVFFVATYKFNKVTELALRYSEFITVVFLKKLFDLLATLAPKIVIKKQYGYLFKNRTRVHFWMTHNAGLFACLSTQIYTIRNLQLNNHALPCSINNYFSMRDFKSSPIANTLPKYFNKPIDEAVLTLENTHPGSSLDVLSHHGTYSDVFNNELTPQWLRSYLNAYMVPSTELSNRISYFTEKYSPKLGKLVGVVFRATDKSTEVAQDPLDSFFLAVDQTLDLNPDSTILIQTDQHQIQQAFHHRYRGCCIHVEELPTTTSNVVLHKIPNIASNKEIWTLDLLAMAFFLSTCHTLIVNTGNVGFFVGMLSLLNGNKVIQFK